jgi:cytochrome P450
MRRLVSKAFTPRAIASWEPVVVDVISRILDGLADREAFDAVVNFAGPFPIEVIAEIVGVPKADRSTVRHWTDEMLEREVGNPFPTESGMLAGMAAAQYYLDLVADRRTTILDDAEGDTDMIGHLLAIEIVRDDGEVDHLADGEIASFIGLLTAAGAETVTKLVGNAIVTFAEWPDQLAVLKADPSVAPSAVEEMLRWRAPSQYQGRYSVADKDWHGVTIPAGQPLLIVTGAANRDPRAYDDPDLLDITRQAAPGITFGYGIHHCIGAHLARLEGRIAFTELYRRWPNLDVDLDHVEYVRMTNVAGPSTVPVHAGNG